VQCSNCGNTWYQDHPDFPLMEEPESTSDQTWAEAEPEPEEDFTAPARRQLDESVTDVLREEAEREARLRQADQSAGLESQPDLGLGEGDDSARRAEEARTRMSRMRGEDPSPPVPDDSEVESRRGLLPDIEDINSTLKSGSTALARPNLDADPEVAPSRKSGFSRGFAIAFLIIAILALIYVQAPAIARMVPALDSTLTAYVGFVDQIRVSLDALMVRFTPE